MVLFFIILKIHLEFLFGCVVKHVGFSPHRFFHLYPVQLSVTEPFQFHILFFNFGNFISTTSLNNSSCPSLLLPHCADISPFYFSPYLSFSFTLSIISCCCLSGRIPQFDLYLLDNLFFGCSLFYYLFHLLCSLPQLFYFS